jgi:acetyl-CoA carboxylase carboxyl transferase subunit alpha
MRITAEDLIGLRVVDRIIKEPFGGAHIDPGATIARVGDVLEEELATLALLSPDAVRTQRAERFYAIGRG